MTDLVWVITSSVLILAVFAIRALFGKRMSAGLRYALWAVVLIRLLIPGTVFSSPVSVQSAAERTETVQNFEMLRGVDAIAHTESGAVEGIVRRAETHAAPAAQQPAESAAPAAQRPAESAAPAAQRPAESAVTVSTLVREATPERFVRMQTALRLRDILKYVWLIGAGVFTLLFIFMNVRFCLQLRSRRRRLAVDCPRPVYSVEKLDSSCLFLGTVYISEETAEDPKRLRFVLEHEKAHYRHGDHITVFLRCAALALHWYNPLVWLAALLSRRDSELFADAGALARLGESEREDYGMTLIELSALRPINAPLLSAATTMTNSKSELRQRIVHIAKKRRMSFLIAAAVLLAVAAAVFFTFTGCKKPAAVNTDDPEANVTEAPTEIPPAKPTAELTPEPTEEPTIAPPAEEWLLDKAWPYAENANRVHGLDFSRENARILTSENSEDWTYTNECRVNFVSEGRACLTVEFIARNGAWQYAYTMIGPDGEEDPSLVSDLSAVELEARMYSNEELIAAGYTPNGTDADLTAAAELLIAEKLSLFETCPENNANRCYEAKAGSLSFYALPIVQGRPAELHAALYFRPEHIGAFAWEYGDVGCGIAGPDSPYPGWVVLTEWLTVSVKRTDGGFAANCYFTGDGGTRPGYIYPDADAMGEIEYLSDLILSSGSSEHGSSEGTWLIRYLYGMDWERFGRDHSVEDWERLAELIKPCVTAQEQIPQVYMDVYVMLGCENAPERWWKGLFTLLNEQSAYDPDAYYEALLNLNEAQLSKVQLITGSFPTDHEGYLTVYESDFRKLAASSLLYLDGGCVQAPESCYGDGRVYFSLEPDGLKAYEKKYVRVERDGSGNDRVTAYYSGLLATFPREVGERANRKLIEYANKYIWWNAPDDANMIDEGYIDTNAVWDEEAKWFALVTSDQSMQDLQVHCIFYNDEGNWIELPGNNGGLYYHSGNQQTGLSLTISGVGVVSKDEIYISYWSKHLWDEHTGCARPYVYRTVDGGRSYSKLDIELPEQFLPDNESSRVHYPLSAVFRGRHGIMLLSGFEDGQMHWLESGDGGRTWEYRER